MENFISDIPQARPEAAKPPMINKKHVELFWKPPKDCSSIKGPIGAYNVTLKGVSAWANMTQPTIMMKGNIDDPSARCENLIPHTQYKASVFLERPSGATNAALSLDVNFTTSPDREYYKM
jgi:hypothetical protein